MIINFDFSDESGTGHKLNAQENKKEVDRDKSYIKT